MADQKYFIDVDDRGVPKNSTLSDMVNEDYLRRQMLDSGLLADEYVNVVGDTMTGPLIITPLTDSTDRFRVNNSGGDRILTVKSLGWTNKYEAEAIPDSTSPTWLNVYSPDPLVSSIVEINPVGKLHLLVKDSEIVGWYKSETVIDADGATIEAKIKIISAPTVGVSFNILAVDSWAKLVITNTQIDLQDGNTGSIGGYIMTTTDDYHVYKISVKNYFATAEVDGVVRASGSVASSPSGAFGFLFSGSGVSVTDVESYWDYVYYQVGNLTSGNLTVNGATISDNYDIGLNGNGVLMLKETTTPTADTNYGKLYTKDTNLLFFQDGAGTEYTMLTTVTGAPIGADYWVSQANATLTAEVNLGNLTTGLLKHTVTAGVSVPATATAGTDYYNPGGTDVALADGGTGASLADPGANKLWGWDDTDNAIKFIILGTGLSYDHASYTLSVSAGGVDHGGLGGLSDDDHTQYFLLAGETTDAKLYSGADLIVYSDAGTTEVARIDGATGDISTARNILIGGSNNELRFYEGVNYVGFEAPALAADRIWVLPNADGTANEALSTDGSGNLTWKDHDELASFVANEHINHTSVSISTSTGLTGGGDISSTRTLSLSFLGLESLTDPNDDQLMGWDDTDNAVKWIDVGTGLSYSHASHILSCSITQYTDEMAQDAVGAMIANTNTVTLAYVDLTPALTATVKYQDTTSVDLADDASGLKATVLPAGVDHSALGSLNTASYTHLTATNHTDLTDGGATTLHKHDHGGMDGLTDDDHTQYLLSAGDTMTGALTNTVDNTDNYVALTLTNNDTTNNPNLFNLVNATTGKGTFYDQNGNGIAIDIDTEATSADTINIDAVNTSGSVVDINLAPGAASTASGLTIDGNSNCSQPLVSITSTGGTNRTLVCTSNVANQYLMLFDMNADGYAVGGLKDTLNASMANASLIITHNVTVTDGNTYTKTGAAITVASDCTETSGVVTDTSGLLNLRQYHADCTGVLAYLINGGAGYDVFVDQNGNGVALHIDSEATGVYTAQIYGKYVGYLSQDISSGWGIYITRNLNEAGSYPLVQFVCDHTADAQGVLKLQNDGTGIGLLVDQNANGYGLFVDKDCTVNNTRTWAVDIDSDNAGTGTALGCGIDMSSFSVDEPLLKVVADAITVLGVISGQIAIDVAGTTYYIPYMAHGT